MGCLSFVCLSDLRLWKLRLGWACDGVYLSMTAARRVLILQFQVIRLFFINHIVKILQTSRLFEILHDWLTGNLNFLEHRSKMQARNSSSLSKVDAALVRLLDLDAPPPPLDRALSRLCALRPEVGDDDSKVRYETNLSAMQFFWGMTSTDSRSSANPPGQGSRSRTPAK